MKPWQVDSMVWVPDSMEEWTRRFVIVPDKGMKFGKKPSTEDSDDSEDAEAVQEIDPRVFARKHGLIGIPLTAGAHAAPGSLLDATSEGRSIEVRRLPNPDHPSAPPRQHELFDAALAAVRDNWAALIQAQTGSGKTVTACHCIGSLGRAALAIVPSTALAHQWAAEVEKHLGIHPDRIGIVTNKVFPPDKDFVAAVVHNMTPEDMPRRWAEQFGLAIWDEAHRMAAPTFSRSLSLVPAKYKLALTATPYRKDGCWQLVADYFGEVAYQAEGDDMETHCFCIYNPYPVPVFLAECENPATVTSWLSAHSARNELIADCAIDLFRKGRRTLIISANVRQLHLLERRLLAKGVKKEQIDFYTGFTLHPDDVLKKKSKPRKRARTQEQLEKVRTNPNLRFVLGTYAQMKEGVNIPWLDAGIDATPQADAVQTVGRLRRRIPGKPSPCWFTIVDEAIPLMKAFAKSRLRGLMQAGITIHETH